MIVSINQPAYLPWGGYFHRIACSDLHIVLDHVQFEKNSFVNRNRIRTRAGWSWLTVPVQTNGRFGALELDRIEVAETDRWRRKHWASISQSYSSTDFFSVYAPRLKELLEQRWERLLPLLDATTGWLRDALEIDTEVIRSAELPVRTSKSRLVLDLCGHVGASVYLSGPLGRGYLELDEFAKAGIEVDFQDFRPPRYEQAYRGFEANLSVIDLLFNHGRRGRDLLLSEPAFTCAEPRP